MKPRTIAVPCAAATTTFVVLGTFGPESLAAAGWLGALLVLVVWFALTVRGSRAA